MPALAQSSAEVAKKPAVEPSKPAERRVINSRHREQIAKLAADGYTVKSISATIGFDTATVKRHIAVMRQNGDIPPSTRKTPRRMPTVKRNTQPRLLPADVVELRQAIIVLEHKICSLQTPPLPCPPKWQAHADEWDAIERRRQQLGADLPAHGDPGFTERTMAAKFKEP